MLICEPSLVSLSFCSLALALRRHYLQKTDPVARVWDSEMLIIIEMNVSEEPRVSKLSAGAVKPLRAAQVSACRGQQRLRHHRGTHVKIKHLC